MDTIVLFALAREHMYFLRQLDEIEAVRGLPCRAWKGQIASRTCMVIETGIGGERVRKALDAGVREQHPRRILFAGFAGGLDPSLRIGDVVEAGEVVGENGEIWRSPTTSTEKRLLSVDRMIGDPAEKQRLREKHQADAVEMESAAFAEWCEARAIPWLCVRAISDTADAALSPELVALMGAGRVSPWRLAWAILRRPSFVAELLRLARDTRHAAQRLAEDLRKLLER